MIRFESARPDPSTSWRPSVGTPHAARVSATTVSPASVVPAPGPRQPDLFDEQLRRVVVAGGEQLQHQRAERQRVDTGDRRGARWGGGDPGTADLDSAVAKELAQDLRGGVGRFGGGQLVEWVEVPVVHEQRRQRSGLFEEDAVLPDRDPSLLVVTQLVADDPPGHSPDAGGNDSVGEILQAGVRFLGEALHRRVDVAVGRERCVSPADEVQVAGDGVAGERTAHLGREDVVGTEHLERDRRGDELQVARRNERLLGVGGDDRRAVQ